MQHTATIRNNIRVHCGLTDAPCASSNTGNILAPLSQAAGSPGVAWLDLTSETEMKRRNQTFAIALNAAGASASQWQAPK
jgi:hypothetical protein